MACRARVRLRHEQPEARWTHPHGTICLAGLCADQVREAMRDAIQRRAIGTAANLEQQDGSGPPVPGMAGRLIEQGDRPVRARVELLWRSRSVRPRGHRAAPWTCRLGTVQEGDDPGRGPLIVVDVGKDETPGPAWSGARWPGSLVLGVCHGVPVYPADDGAAISRERSRGAPPCGHACPPDRSPVPQPSPRRRASATSGQRPRTRAGVHRTACRARR